MGSPSRRSPIKKAAFGRSGRASRAPHRPSSNVWDGPWLREYCPCDDSSSSLLIMLNNLWFVARGVLFVVDIFWITIVCHAPNQGTESIKMGAKEPARVACHYTDSYINSNGTVLSKALNRTFFDDRANECDDHKRDNKVTCHTKNKWWLTCIIYIYSHEFFDKIGNADFVF